MNSYEYNKQWEIFIKKTERRYINFALTFTKNLEDAKDVVYITYGKLCQKDYNFHYMEHAGLTIIKRIFLNRHRSSIAQRNKATIMYINEVPLSHNKFFTDKYSDIESELIIKDSNIQIKESKILCNKSHRNAGKWPFVEKYMGF